MASQSNDPEAALSQVIAELARFDRPGLLIQPDENGTATPNSPTPFALTEQARRRLSPETLSLLEDRGLNPTEMSIDVVIQALLNEKLEGENSILVWPKPVITVQPGASLPPAPG